MLGLTNRLSDSAGCVMALDLLMYRRSPPREETMQLQSVDPESVTHEDRIEEACAAGVKVASGSFGPL